MVRMPIKEAGMAWDEIGDELPSGSAYTGGESPRSRKTQGGAAFAPLLWRTIRHRVTLTRPPLSSRI